MLNEQQKNDEPIDFVEFMNWLFRTQSPEKIREVAGCLLPMVTATVAKQDLSRREKIINQMENHLSNDACSLN